MTIQAVVWVLEHSEAGGTERLVAISLANHADRDGLASLSLATIGREAHVSEDTARRSVKALIERGEVEEVDPTDAPSWWLAIRADRRPRLIRMVGFTGSQSATPSIEARGSNGVATGSRSYATRTVETENQPPAGSSPSKRSRPRNDVWDAIARACLLPLDTARLTRASKGMLVSASTDIRKVGGTAAQVPKVAAAYRSRFPGAELTPTALAKWWPSLVSSSPSGEDDDPGPSAADELRNVH